MILIEDLQREMLLLLLWLNHLQREHMMHLLLLLNALQHVLNADGDALIANYAYGEWFDTWGQDVEVTRWMPVPEATEEGGKHE